MKLFPSALVLGTLASAGAVVASALAAGNQYIDAWENLQLEDCDGGEFCTLENGWRLRYLEKGEGEPVVLLHGFMDSLYGWKQNFDVLAAGHRVVALDAPGFGFSERVMQPVYSLKHLSRVLKQFLDSRGIMRATLIGHSMGGALAAQFTYDFPESVDKLVLEAAAVYLQVPSTKVLMNWIPRSVPRGALGLYAMRQEYVELALMNAYGDSNRLRREAIESRVRAHRVRGNVDALLSILESPRESDLPRAIPQIQQPTLLIWGARDRIVPLSHGRRLRRELPNSKLAVLTTAGHIPHEEFPDEVNGLIGRFLAGGLEKLEDLDGQVA